LGKRRRAKKTTEERKEVSGKERKSAAEVGPKARSRVEIKTGCERKSSARLEFLTGCRTQSSWKTKKKGHRIQVKLKVWHFL